MIATAAVAGLAVAVVAGFAAGRATSDINLPAPTTVTATPKAQAFTASDVTWCAEFTRAGDAAVDRGKANGWPRNISGRDVPASAWTAEESAANAQFRQYIALFADGSMRDLAARSHNPTLTMLMSTQIAATDSVTQALDAGTYQPSNYRDVLSVSGSGTAIQDICTEIAKS